MNERHYLLDNNALSVLTGEELTSPLVLTRCRITSEVLAEAPDFVDVAPLRPLEVPTTLRILQLLEEVMATGHGAALVDLYHFEGTADPVLVATALALEEEAGQTLFGQEWVIVTDDRDLRVAAHRFGVASMSSRCFRQLLDSS